MKTKIKFINYLFSILFITIALTFCFNILNLFLLKISILTLVFLLIIINLIYYHNRAIKIHPTHRLELKAKQAAILFYIFLIISLFLGALILFLDKSISNYFMRVLSSIMCLSLICSWFFVYKFESYKFFGKKNSSELRAGGLAINPYHPLGKVIYGSVFVVILLVLLISIFVGPTQ